MYDDLKDLLLNYLAPESAAIYLEAYQVLIDLGMDGQDAELLNIMGIPNDVIDNQQLVGAVEACLTVGVGSLLNQYGVTVSGETPLTVMTELALALGTFDRYCFEQQTITLFDDPELDDVMLIAEVVAGCSVLEVVDVTTYVTDVRETTIRRLKTIVEETMELHPRDADEPDVTLKERARIINNIIRDIPTVQPLLVKDVADKGISFNARMDVILDDIIDQLDEITDPHRLALELLAIAVYSTWNWMEALPTLVGDYVDSPLLERAVNNELKTYLTSKGYTHAKA